MRRSLGALGLIGVLLALSPAHAADAARPRKVVLIAGPLDKSHPPGTHEYEKSVRLLKFCLDTSPNVKGLRTEAHLGGWPSDPRTLDDADTIVLVASGSDRREQDHPLLVGDHLRVVERQMKRGCGLVLIHWATFVPRDKAGAQALEWVGGYFDYESGPPPQHGYSKIQVATTTARPATPGHPVCRGLSPFQLREEYYYHIRFRENDPRLVPILKTPIPGEKDDQIVAWAVQRQDGGRGFAFTGGHFFDNWRLDNFRRMVLNAVAWTAGAEVPAGGVQSKAPTDTELARVPAEGPPAAAALVEGRFGSALDGRRHYAEVKHQAVYQKPPLTVECWARLGAAQGFNLLVANNRKESSTHWEIYSIAASGNFSAFLPGSKPDVIDSHVPITDGKWHHLAMVYETERVRLFVDGKQVTDQRIERQPGSEKDGPLWFGAYPPQALGCDGVVDEVRIRRGAHINNGLPDRPFGADETTLGLWHLDAVAAGVFADASAVNSPARLHAVGPAPQGRAGPSSDTELDYRPADPRLKAVVIDRSAEESYVSVKSDSEGRLFVGGREALFVFEPDGKGGYRPRRQLYRFPPDSWVAGIEVRGNDLYVLTAAALYLFPEGRTKHDGLKPRRLLWGLPLDLHVSFHCLAWGPEGDLYLTHGDPLLNYGDFSRPDHWGHWTLFAGPEGKPVPYTGQGAVLRLHPDGSGLRVVARGLRGPFGLAFDHAWNLFTNDNDHESMPDRYTPARLLYVSPHVDFAWPRGWMASKSPDRADLVEPLLSAPGRGVPVGLAYYDEALLPAEYRNTLLEDRWDRLRIQRHPLHQCGAGFATEDLPFLVGSHEARPIGVAVGPGGETFATVSYMAANEASPHYVSDLVAITPADHPATPALYDITTAPADKLWAELSNRSWQRRLQAHTEILRRGGPLLSEAVRRLATVSADDPAMAHLPWLAAASGSSDAVRELAGLAKHPRADVRLQAVRALGEFFRGKAPGGLLEAALADTDPQVRLAALTAFFGPDVALPFAAVSESAGSSDDYLRQTAARLLARRATLGQLQGLLHARHPAERRAAVLAAGIRLTTPPDEPPPQVRLVYPAENAFFKVKIHYADGEADLRALGRVGSYSTAEYWKAITPTAEQAALFRLLDAALQDPCDSVRVQAAYYLSLLRDPRSEAAVARTFTLVQEHRLARGPLHTVEKVWTVGPFPNSGDGSRIAHPPEQGVIDLTARYQTPSGPATWETADGRNGIFDLRPPPSGEPCLSYVFFQLQSTARQPALLLVGTEEGVGVWHNGRSIGEGSRPGTLLLDLQPGSNDLLVRLRPSRGVRLQFRAPGQVTAALPEKLGFATLAQRLKEAAASGKQATVAPEFLAVDWQQEVRRGNAAEGRKLFGTLGCVKCHAITAGQKGGGAPSLTEAGKRFTVPYLVESVLLPSKQVAEPFRSTNLVTTGGQVVSGLVVNETADSLELLLPDTSHRIVAKKDVEERTVTAVSPMPAGLVKTPRELRDLLAYLLSDNPQPP